MHHHDYWEYGIHTIPLTHALLPLVRYSEITQEDYDNGSLQMMWDINYSLDKGYGIGIAFGKGSDLIAIDIDTRCEKKMDTIRRCIPKTPCEKFGSKGATLFFRKDHYWKTRRKILLNEIEIFCSSNTYVAVPPSINRKNGKQYLWTKETLIDSYDYLPEINEHDLEMLTWMFRREKDGDFFKEAGRNNWLISKAGWLAKKDWSLEEKTSYLYEEDLTKHKNDPWFHDYKEHRGKARNMSGLERARYMMEQIQKKENK